MNMKIWLNARNVQCFLAARILFCLGLFWAVHTEAALTIIDDFESPGSPAPWTFTNDSGAIGSLTPTSSGHTGKGTHLTFNLTKGGAYVGASLQLFKPISTLAFTFWVKSLPGVKPFFRVTDTQGQILEFRGWNGWNRPLYALDASDWYPMMVQISSPSSHWGGANDGKIHGGIQSISILAEPLKDGDAYARSIGAIDFDEVAYIDSFTSEIDPFSTGIPLPGRESLADKLGVNDDVKTFMDDRALNAMQSLGLKWARACSLFWSLVEKKETKGSYDFSYFDQLLSKLESHGIKVLFNIDGRNVYLYNDNNAPVTDERRAAFGTFVKATAQRFARKGVRYEIWNEPNYDDEWPPKANATDYALLSQLAIKQVKAGDPKAQVSTGGVGSTFWQYIRDVLASGGAQGADAIGLHPYGNPTGTTDNLLFIRSLISQALPTNTPPVWNTEVGFSSSWYEDGFSLAARLRQAICVANGIVSAWVEGYPLIIYHRLWDANAHNPKITDQNYGLLTYEWQEKPAMVALRTLLNQANGRTLTAMIPGLLANLNVVKLEGAHDIVLIIWQQDGKNTFEVHFPQAPSQVIDYLGNPVPWSDLGSGRASIKVGGDGSLVYCIFPKNPSNKHITQN